MYELSREGVVYYLHRLLRVLICGGMGWHVRENFARQNLAAAC